MAMDEEYKGATIMVVDDFPPSLNLLRDMLRTQGYRVLAFPKGRLALNAAAKNPPDLILLDINMPDMNGFEVCNRLKANDALKDIPVIFTSAMTKTEDKVLAFSTGAVDYISKPLHFDEVHARIKTHLRLRKFQTTVNRHDSQSAIFDILSMILEYRDGDTGRHIERMQYFCKVLAEQLRRNPRYASVVEDTFIENIYHASPLHDIGKIGIPDTILLKPGKLTTEEFDIMKDHAVIGAKILQTVHKKYPSNAFLDMGIAIAESHHERWDGSGYPKKLSGEDIHLAARIAAVADVYEALHSKRPYKPPFSHEKSVEIISRERGTHFDPTVVDVFMAVETEFDTIFKQMCDGAV